MKINLSLHDFSVLNNRLDQLEELRSHFPGFRVSLFTIPNDIKNKVGDRKAALKRIKGCLDWIEIVPHGIKHNGAEISRMTYWEFRDGVMGDIRKYFERDGLPYVNGFCAPHWAWNTEVVRALDDEGWWGAISPQRPSMAKTKRIYRHTHSIDGKLDRCKGEAVKLYGHLDGLSLNDLDVCFDNLLELPRDLEWHFASEFVEEPCR
jgi:hypothetical protein